MRRMEADRDLWAEEGGWGGRTGERMGTETDKSGEVDRRTGERVDGGGQWANERTEAD